MARPERSGLERVLIGLGAIAAVPFVLMAFFVALPFTMIAGIVGAARRTRKPEPKTPLEEGKEILAGFLEEEIRARRDAQGHS